MQLLLLLLHVTAIAALFAPKALRQRSVMTRSMAERRLPTTRRFPQRFSSEAPDFAPDDYTGAMQVFNDGYL